jgi:hypothetical protein
MALAGGDRVVREVIGGTQVDYAWNDEQRGRVLDLSERAMGFATTWTNPDPPPSSPVDPHDLPKPDLSLFPLPEETTYDAEQHPFVLGLPTPRPVVRIVRDF